MTPTITAASLIVWLLGAALTTSPIPLDNTNADAFFVQPEPPAPPELVVLDGSTVHIHRFANGNRLRSIHLPDDASAVDIADIDEDGVLDVLAIQANRITRFNPEAGPATGEWQTLFEASNELGKTFGKPRAYPFITAYEGRFAVLLPRRTALEVRALDGTPLAEHPYGYSQEDSTALAPTFTRRLSDPPQAAPPDSIEFVLSAHDGGFLSYPELAESENAPLPSRRPATLRQMREVSDLPPRQWPWFAVDPKEPSGLRSHYALASHDFRHTLISIGTITGPASAGASTADGPGAPRRYPGVLIPRAAGAFDANGDGFMDLLLWKSPLPGRSIRTISRALHGNRWPVELTVHLFDAERGLYAPRPAGRIETDVPATWLVSFEESAPIRNLVTTDLDGDGDDDLAFNTGPNTFRIWLYEQGFSREPEYSYRLSEPEVVLDDVAPAGDHGGAIVLLRGEHTLYPLKVPANQSS